MTAAVHDLTFEQGSTFSLDFTYLDEDDTPVDLSTIVRMEMELRPTKSGALLGRFTLDDGYFSITDAVEGEFKLEIPYSVMEDLSFTTAFYDVELEFTSGLKERLCEGRAFLVHEVTTGDLSNSAMSSNIQYMASYQPAFATLAGIPVKMSVVTSLVEASSDFIHTSNRATYTGTITKRFAALWSVSASFDQAAVPSHFALYKNGVKIEASEQDGLRGTAGQVGNNMGPTFVTLETGDYIEMWITNSIDCGTLVKHLSVLLFSL